MKPQSTERRIMHKSVSGAERSGGKLMRDSKSMVQAVKATGIYQLVVSQNSWKYL